MKKNKYILLLLLLVLIFFQAGCVFAGGTSLETKYFGIPGLPNLNKENAGIGDFIQYFFGLGIYIAGFIALISFTIGAIGLIASMDSPEAQSSAKDRIKGSILGLVLTMASYIIMTTINPTIVSLNFQSFSSVLGVFYTNGNAEQDKAMPQMVSDLANRGEGLNGYNKMIYKCSADSGQPPLLVWKYPKPNFKGSDNKYAGVEIKRLNCGESLDIGNSGSLTTAYEGYGIYYFLGTGCTGYGEGPLLSSQKLPDDLSGKIKSIRIMNDLRDTSNKSYFGAIFQNVQKSSEGGLCADPIYNNTDSNADANACKNIDSTITSYINIFGLNKDPKSSGNGVIFFSEPFGQNIGSEAGFYPGSKQNLNIQNPYSKIESEKMSFDYTNITQNDEYQNRCKTFQNCSGSIKINGDYLVGIYSKNGSNKYCQIFNEDVPNLKAQPILKPGAEKIDTIYIVPTK